MWQMLLAGTAAQALSGSKASGAGVGVGTAAGGATVSPTSRADFGSQDFSFGNISLAAGKDNTALWIGGAALIVAIAAAVLVVRG